jgi:hypothetical protein
MTSKKIIARMGTRNGVFVLKLIARIAPTIKQGWSFAMATAVRQSDSCRAFLL